MNLPLRRTLVHSVLYAAIHKTRLFTTASSSHPILLKGFLHNRRRCLLHGLHFAMQEQNQFRAGKQMKYNFVYRRLHFAQR